LLLCFLCEFIDLTHIWNHYFLIIISAVDQNNDCCDNNHHVFGSYFWLFSQSFTKISNDIHQISCTTPAFLDQLLKLYTLSIRDAVYVKEWKRTQKLDWLYDQMHYEFILHNVYLKYIYTFQMSSHTLVWMLEKYFPNSLPFLMSCVIWIPKMPTKWFQHITLWQSALVNLSNIVPPKNHLPKRSLNLSPYSG
jgi:hypothetical protein